MLKNLREAQIDLDNSIKSLAAKIVIDERKYGSITRMEVEVSSYKASVLNRLLKQGVLVVALLPVVTLLNFAVGNKKLDSRLLNKPFFLNNSETDATLSDLNNLMYLGVLVNSGHQAKKEIKLKKNKHQTFIVVYYKNLDKPKKYFVYDIDPNEKPENMDKVILKRVTTKVLNIKNSIQNITTNNYQ